MNRKRIYISGPISGRDRADTLHEFNRVADAIMDAGNIPVNPMDIEFWDLDWNTYMDIAFRVLLSGKIDMVYMLPGWEDSKGASLERECAMAAGIPVAYQ